ncbi:MAG: ABC transporter substrate-binding protein [Sulfobacillus acidophilus]|uniref:ABC transporter substrate-binding protein n=1 Tax=Sulfobacillus acidophilus TaxID=53633 RepID=A0A2T2WLW8_9FIRM|nr:MAG: ABC transporter substrate-binding protein [Sulfobacillus acidophilus]
MAVRFGRIALTSGVVISLAALGTAGGQAWASSGAAQSTGTIVEALAPQTEVTWYNPLQNSANDTLLNSQVGYMLYMPLIYINANYQVDYQYSVAKRVTYNKAGTVYHVYLNPKYKWSDGAPVTSADVLWTWHIIQAISSTKAPSPWPYANADFGDIPNGVKSVVANGKYALTVTLNAPTNQEWFIYDGLSQLLPLPKQAWDKYPQNMSKEIAYLGQEATNPKFDSVVDGPYTLASAVPSQAWKFAVNKHYTGGPLAHDNITLEYEGSDEAEFAALQTRTVQLGYLDLSEWGARRALQGIDNLWAGYNLGYDFLAVNMNANAANGLGPVFSQLYVRQAIAEAIDQNAIDQDIYHGYAPPQYGPIPTRPVTVFLDPALRQPVYPFNLAHAKALLTSHGWKEIHGVMTKDGQSLAFPLMYASGNQTTVQTVTLVQSDLAKIGIKVTLEPKTSTTELSIVTGEPSQWDAVGAFGITFSGYYPAGDAVFYSGGGLDFFGWHNTQEDDLIDDFQHKPATSLAANLQAYFNFEEYTAKELPVIFMNRPGTIEAVATNLHGVNLATLNPVTGYGEPQLWSLSAS